LFPRRYFALISVIILAGCRPAPTPPLTVAAAANLTNVFRAIGAEFQGATGIPVKFSFAATGDLTRQIENAAPFDVFAGADVDHVHQLEKENLLLSGTVHVYARGQLALFGRAHSLQELATDSIRFVAIARPEAAPYGRAAVEALQSAGLWKQVEPKVVYAENINISRQYAVTGNADAAFTAYSLVLLDKPVLIDPKLYSPIEQGIGVVKSSEHLDAARRFVEFVTGPQGQRLLQRNGYNKPQS
jgi:molybdate transport system substrate-binding protein